MEKRKYMEFLRHVTREMQNPLDDAAGFMAQSDDLLLFKAACDLLEQLIGLAKELPKFFRYSIGARMVDLCLDLLGQIFRANMSQKGREQVLTDLLIDYRQLQMLFRVCYRLKVFSMGRYVELISKLDTIGRQAAEWKNKTQESNE